MTYNCSRRDHNIFPGCDQYREQLCISCTASTIQRKTVDQLLLRTVIYLNFVLSLMLKNNKGEDSLFKTCQWPSQTKVLGGVSNYRTNYMFISCANNATPVIHRNSFHYRTNELHLIYFGLQSSSEQHRIIYTMQCTCPVKFYMCIKFCVRF